MTDDEQADDREEPLGELADEIDEAEGPDGPDVDDDDEGAFGAAPGPDHPSEAPDAAGDDEPLGELAGRVDDRERDQADDDLFERAFEDVGVEEADAEALWEDLESESPDSGIGQPAVEAEGENYIVDKREYCLRCQHFSEPPDVRCTYEGSEIVEVTETGEFKVRDCPIVQGEEDIQDIGR